MKTKIDVNNVFKEQYQLFFDKYHDADLAYRKALQYIVTHRSEYNYL